VFQHYAAFKHLSVARNVSFGLEIRKVPKDEIHRRVTELLDLVHLGQFADRLPSSCPAGSASGWPWPVRWAVEPKVLLLDEPFGALDAKVRKELREWLRRLHDEVHVTTVFVTHDQEEALEVADEIVVINEGRIEQIGTPDSCTTSPPTTRHAVHRARHPARRPPRAPARHRGRPARRRGRRRRHGQPHRSHRLRGPVEVTTAPGRTVQVTLSRGERSALGLEVGTRVWLRHVPGAPHVSAGATVHQLRAG
jgi:sulfate transport system ATP-binding protein